MTPRITISLFAAAMALVGPLHVSAFAQDPVQAELAQLRKLIDQQNTKIDTLSAQIARLSAQLDSKAAPTPQAPQPAVTEEAAPTPRVIAQAPKVHIVVKGESLDKIAKQHGITIAEIQKLNKISDPKKILVGQQLTLPPEKKE
jgi:LysM repeat protein